MKIGVEWEGLVYVLRQFFERLTGKEMQYPYEENLETTGEQWHEDGDGLSMSPKIEILSHQY